ncbi:MAG: MFS transporter, partial [Muribaculaceae bacterium]|nr:MFS transporter [Muribaculaceae bacterium]
MAWLIIISCLLGCAAGLLIPFSTGLIADTFSGNYRMQQMGIQSGIANSALVVATFVVGWLSHGNWHLPFAVYLVCLIPLVLVFWLRKVVNTPTDASTSSSSSSATAAATPSKAAGGEKTVGGFYVGKLWALIGVYFFITFASISISYYCPFLIEKKDWSASLSGTITAIYFLFILLPGYFLPFFMKVLKGNTFFWAAIMMMAGQALFVFCADSVTMCIGAALVGLGYGISQPIIYDKAAQCVDNEKKATMALSFVLTANYLAIVVSPFLIGLLRDIFHVAAGGTFAFLISFILLIAYAVITFLMRKKFAFSVNAN